VNLRTWVRTIYYAFENIKLLRVVFLQCRCHVQYGCLFLCLLDQRRMREIVAYLTRLRLCQDKIEKLKQREVSV